jgi:hypothetical protein
MTTHDGTCGICGRTTRTCRTSLGRVSRRAG